MKNTKVIDSVLDFIKSNPGSSVEAITVGTKSSDILVRGAIKALLAEGAIIADSDTGAYSFNKEGKAAPEKSPSSSDNKKTETKTAKKKDDDDLGPKTVYPGRDNSKYWFGEQRNLAKSRLVLALVRAYVERNQKVSLPKLQELFHSEELQPRYHVILELSAAKKFSKNKVDRHFVKNPEDVIKLANGTKIAICNQWTKEGIDKLIKIVSAPPIGFKVKVEAAK